MSENTAPTFLRRKRVQDLGAQVLVLKEEMRLAEGRKRLSTGPKKRPTSREIVHLKFCSNFSSNDIRLRRRIDTLFDFCCRNWTCAVDTSTPDSSWNYPDCRARCDLGTQFRRQYRRRAFDPKETRVGDSRARLLQAGMLTSQVFVPANSPNRLHWL